MSTLKKKERKENQLLVYWKESLLDDTQATFTSVEEGII